MFDAHATGPIEPLSDRQVLDLVRNGRCEAFRLIVDRYEGAVASTVIAMLGPGSDADEVGQEAFVRFFASLGTFRGDASVKTYLTRIAINLAIDAIHRRRRGLRRFISRDDPDAAVIDPAADGARDVEARERSALVRQAIRRLAPNHRAVVVLRMLEGHSTRETAALLGVPEGTVLSRLARALDALKPLLSPLVHP
jgi:RNA polymerase sigma-70 factor (ECF subfamily)